MQIDMIVQAKVMPCEGHARKTSGKACPEYLAKSLL
jgi:hypothetical protein